MNKKLGPIVKHYRTEKGLSQEELGRAIGHTGKTSISKIECGTNDANSETLIKIARALDVSPAVFVVSGGTEGDCSEYIEYLPYLEKASSEALRIVRFILNMPEAVY